MPLTEKLRGLRAVELAEERKRQAVERETARLKAEELERKRAETERLKKIVRERFLPSFEEVNRVYLGGRGEITMSDFDEDYILRIEPSFFLNLVWDVSKKGEYWEEREERGERLTISLDANLEARVKGGGKASPEVQFRLNDKNWKEQFEDGIISILSTPGACDYLSFFRPPEKHFERYTGF